MSVPDFAVTSRSVLDDFKGLNTKDVGTWPFAPRLLAVVVVFSIIVLLGWALFLRAELQELDEREQEEFSLKDEYTAKKSQAVNLDLYKTQLAEIDKAFGALLKQLPNKAEIESLLVEINQSGMGRGLQFELFKPGQENVKDFYAELPVNIKLIGSYHDFGAFASDVASLSRIVTLGNLSISTNAQAKDGGGLVMECQARTYRYLDDDEIAARKREEAEKKQGRRK